MDKNILYMYIIFIELSMQWDRFGHLKGN